MTKISKIKNAIKRKVNESRVRKVVSSILDDSLPNLLAEIDQLDQAFLDAKPVKEEEDLEELDVRKTHGDRRIENPATGNDIKLRTALKAKKGSAVYAKGKAMYNALKDKPANEGKLAEVIELVHVYKNGKMFGTGELVKGKEKGNQVLVRFDGSKTAYFPKKDVKLVERAYASTDGKPYFDYDPGEGKLTEAFKKGDKVKYLGHPAVITHVEDRMGKTYYSVSYNKGTGKTKARMVLSTDGSITEAKKIKPHDLGYRMNVRRAKADFKKGENIAATSKSGKGSFKIEDINDFNKYPTSQWNFAYIVKEGKLSEAKIKKGDVIKMDDGEIGVVNKVKGRVAYIKLPSSPGSFHPIEADRTTYKGKYKGKDIYSETKSAPAGHYFTKGGNVVKGRLSKAARSKGATKSDPKDKQRSKVPAATQRNESAKDKFGAPPMNKWWTGSKDALMSAIYHAQRQVPPSNKAAYEKNWKNIVKQLQRKFPAPTAIYRKRLDEDYSQRARNFRVALRRRLEAMKSGKKIKYGKLAWTALGNGNFKDSRGRTVPGQDIVQDLKFAVKGDILHHRGAAGDDMVNAYLKFEGKLTEAHPLNKVIGGYPVRYEGDPKNYRAIVSGLTNDRAREDIIKRASKAGYIAKPNMGGGVTIFVKEGKLTEAKFYVTYNQGRGMGKKVVTSKESDFEDPRVFRNYNDAEKYVKMAKSGGGSPGRITAYWVSDANMNRIDKAGRLI